MREKKHVVIENFGERPSYKKVLERIIKDRVCPFCEKNFLTYHTPPILRKSKYWIVTENMNPYKGSKKHMLFVFRKHAVKISQMPAVAGAELLQHAQWVQKKYKLKGATLFMRFGEPGFTGASVEHLHAQLVSGQKNSKTKEPLFVVAGYKNKK